jgi:hypothetical protein
MKTPFPPRFLLLLVTTAAATTASATPIPYLLNFAGGGFTPVGGFSYDSTVLHASFSNFIVTAGGQLFDFTNAGNNAVGVTGTCFSSSDAAGVVHALTTTGCLNEWQYNPSTNHTITVLALGLCKDIDASPCTVTAALFASVPWIGSSPGTTSGFVSATQVPDPSTVHFMLIGALLITTRARRLRPSRVAPVNLSLP